MAHVCLFALQELNKLSQLSKTAWLEAGRLAAQDPEGLELYDDVRGEWVLFRPSGWDESLGGSPPLASVEAAWTPAAVPS